MSRIVIPKAAILLLISLVACSGCAGPNISHPFEALTMPSAKKKPWFGGNKSKSAYAIDTYANPVAKKIMQATKPARTPKQAIGDSMRKAGNLVAKYKPVPKNVEPLDPLSLSTTDQQVAPELLLQAARVFESRGQVQQALEHYQKVLDLTPNELKALVAKARLLDRTGDIAEAERLYRKAVQVHPSSALAFNDLGMLLARHGRGSEAGSFFEQAIKIVPDKPLYRNNLAQLLMTQGKTDLAVDQLTKVYPQAVAMYNAAHMLKSIGQPSQARDLLAQAVQLDPSMHQAKELLATLVSANVLPSTVPVAPLPDDLNADADRNSVFLPVRSRQNIARQPVASQPPRYPSTGRAALTPTKRAPTPSVKLDRPRSNAGPSRQYSVPSDNAVTPSYDQLEIDFGVAAPLGR